MKYVQTSTQSRWLPKKMGLNCMCQVMTYLYCLLQIIALMGWSSSAWAGVTPDSELTSMSLEELMEIDVTSVAKRPQELEQAAAAVSVITQEDIRRSFYGKLIWRF